MIHVHGGSALLHKLRAAGLPGDFLEWCDVLCQGPVPGGLAPDAFRAARAAFLAEDFGPANGRDSLAQLEAQDRALERALDHDEMVLWFGPELFCQAILMYLLHWLNERRDRLPRHVSIVCVGEYPTIFLAALWRLASGRAPLVALDWGPADPRPFPRAMRLTPLARDVLAGRRDWIAENGIDRWVGGVHLMPGNVWRWDSDRGRVVPPGT